MNALQAAACAGTLTGVIYGTAWVVSLVWPSRARSVWGAGHWSNTGVPK